MPAIFRFIFVALAFIAMAALPLKQAQAGTIYSYVDEDGVVHFTDYRPANRRGVKVEVYAGAPKKAKPSFRSKTQFDEAIKEIAIRYRLEPAIVKAVIHAESNFDPFAVSRKGAEGLMQLMPATAEMLAVANSFDPIANIEGGSKYLRYLYDKFNGDLKLILAAYNAGEGAVSRYNGVPPFKETREYVQKVLAFYENYSGLFY